MKNKKRKKESPQGGKNAKMLAGRRMMSSYETNKAKRGGRNHRLEFWRSVLIYFQVVGLFILCHRKRSNASIRNKQVKSSRSKFNQRNLWETVGKQLKTSRDCSKRKRSLKKKLTKSMDPKEGNRSKKVKIDSWNPGGELLFNKISELKLLIELTRGNYTVHILIVQKAN